MFQFHDIPQLTRHGFAGNRGWLLVSSPSGNAGAFLVRSSPFLADGPPRDGQVQSDPTEGFAVETKCLAAVERKTLVWLCFYANGSPQRGKVASDRFSFELCTFGVCLAASLGAGGSPISPTRTHQSWPAENDQNFLSTLVVILRCNFEPLL